MPPRKPLQKATVSELACDDKTAAKSDVNKGVLDKIQKCLSRALHANASEAEAKTALFISQKLMSQHNVSQADLIDNEAAGESKAQHGGQSIVQIDKVGGSSTRTEMETFVGTLATAIRTFFDCKVYSTNYRMKITWTFYGIASNTVAAAIAFEAVHNLIIDWSMSYKGRSATCSYRRGIADGLWRMADREKKAELEEARRKEAEEVERQAIEARKAQEAAENRNRVAQQPQKVKLEEVESDEQELDDGSTAPRNHGYSTDEDFDSSDDQDDPDGIKTDFNENDIPVIDLCSDVDIDETIDNFMKREPSESPLPSTLPVFLPGPNRVKEEPETPESTSHWKSEMQLVLFRKTSQQVAEDYLTEQKIKLGKGKKRRLNISDQESYQKGRKDSEKVDVRQKKLRN